MDVGRAGRVVALVVSMAAAGPGVAGAQPATVLFEDTVRDLASDDPRVRLRAVESLKETPYDEAAVPLARVLIDPDDRVQMQAIAAELNIYLADRIVPRRRVGMVVELRRNISAASVFEQGSEALDPRPVPVDVLTAMRTASRDEHPQVAVEALYAFGALADNAYGRSRVALLSSSADELAGSLGAAETRVRAAALRVIGRMYAWRPGDPGIPQMLGDAVVTLLNDRVFEVRMAAIDTLGAMRYERAVQSLTDLFQHYERGTTASAALSALARIAHPSSEALFVAALPSRDVPVRTAAIEGLARLGVVAQASAIANAAANERNPEVLLAAQFANVLLRDGPVDELVEALTHSRTHARALQYLAEAIPGRASIVAPHMPDPQVAVRVDLLDAAGLSGDGSALSLVDRLADDADPQVARAVQRARARLGADTAAQR